LADAIVQLATSCEQRAALGAAGRARCESDYSVARATELWATMLETD
jgi:hypothetical protein